MKSQVEKALGVVESVNFYEEKGKEALTVSAIKRGYSYEELGRALELIDVLDMLACIANDYRLERHFAEDFERMKSRREGLKGDGRGIDIQIDFE